MADLYHECGIAAVYHLPDADTSGYAPQGNQEKVSKLIPRILLDIQNRGQLAAGMTTYNPECKQLIDTHKDVGSVSEVFHLSHPVEGAKLMEDYSGRAAIGHVRYATCGKDDRSYAQPFERHHIERSKWFSFAFNGQLSNYKDLKKEILSETDFHLARETDTEILMHMICQELTKDPRVDLSVLLRNLSQRLDGAYNIVYLNARGDMFISRDPLGIRPLCYAIDGPEESPRMVVAASESVALANLGFEESQIKSLEPGHALLVRDGKMSLEKYVESPRRAHCFFEWIYFANAASTLDDRSVYLTRKALGEALAKQETVEIDSDTIVVPVPDTAKGAAASMAFELNIPCLEGLLRNRYAGRTFIDSTNRADKVRMKYTPLPEVLEGKKILLVEDTIVRSTTMKVLISQLKERGKVKEVHIRVACPPIISPCFYGIDMSTIDELFAPKFMQGTELTPEIEDQMADAIGADSLRYLPINSISECLEFSKNDLCQACIDTSYPTQAGTELYQLALESAGTGDTLRIFDAEELAPTRT